MRVLRPYLDILLPLSAWRFSVAAWFGRFVRATTPISTVLLVTSGGDDYALGGLASGAVVVGTALAGPVWSIASDRLGQRHVIPVALACSAGAAVLLLVAVRAGLPAPVWIAAAFLVGATAIDMGALARARWLHLLDAPGSRHTALALESVADEFTFVIGPPVVTLVAALASPAVGFATGVGLALAGGLALWAQRSTAPRPAPSAAAPRLRDWLPGGVIGVLPVYLGIGLMFGSVDLVAVGIADEAGTDALAGLLLAAFAVGSASSGVLFGVVAARWSTRRRLLVAGGLFLVVVPCFALVRDPVGFAVVSLLAGLATTPVLISSSALIESLVGRGVITTAMSWPTVALSLGVTLGASASGAAVDAGRLYAGLVVPIASALVVAATAGLNVALRGRRTSAPEDAATV